MEVVALIALVALLAWLLGWLWWRWLMRRKTVWSERLSAAIPVNSAWWRELRERDGSLLYVAIGDSAAQGIGASRPGHSYVGMLARHIRELSDTSVRVINLSVSGATVGTALDKQLPALRRLDPDIVTVSIGANDIAHFHADRFRRELRRLYEQLPDHAIVADLPTFYFLPGERHVRVANRILRAEAERLGLTVAPLYAATRRQGLWGVITHFAGDLFHPNDRGYRVWAEAFHPAVQQRIREVARRG